MSIGPFFESGAGAATFTTPGSARQLVYNVRDYGARGDGQHDDTSAIQSAINAAGAAGGGLVFLPAGTYAVSSTLSVTASGIQMAGAGASTVIANGSATADTILVDAPDHTFPNRPYRNAVRGLRFAPSVTRTAGTELNVARFEDFRGEGLSFYGVYRALSIGSINDASATQISRWRDLIAWNFTQFIYAANTLDPFFSQLWMQLNQTSGDSIAFDSGVIGGGISQSDLTGGAAPTYIGNCLHLMDSTGGNPPRLMTFTDTLFDSHSQAVLHSAGFANMFAGCWFSARGAVAIGLEYKGGEGLMVKASKIMSCGSHGILLDGGIRAVIDGCYVCNNNESGTQGGVGIAINGSDDLTIINNHIYNTTGAPGLPGTQPNAIYFASQPAHMVIAGNDMRGNTGAALNNAPATPTVDQIIANNITS